MDYLAYTYNKLMQDCCSTTARSFYLPLQTATLGVRGEEEKERKRETGKETEENEKN